MPIAKHRADLAELISIAALQRKRINQRHRRHHSIFHVHDDSFRTKFQKYLENKQFPEGGGGGGGGMSSHQQEQQEIQMQGQQKLDGTIITTGAATAGAGGGAITTAITATGAPGSVGSTSPVSHYDRPLRHALSHRLNDLSYKVQFLRDEYDEVLLYLSSTMRSFLELLPVRLLRLFIILLAFFTLTVEASRLNTSHSGSSSSSSSGSSESGSHTDLLTLIILFDKIIDFYFISEGICRLLALYSQFEIMLKPFFSSPSPSSSSSSSPSSAPPSQLKLTASNLVGFLRRSGILDVVISSCSLSEGRDNTGNWVRLVRVLIISSFTLEEVPHLEVLMSGITFGMKSIASTWLLLGVIFLVYASCGMTLFRENDPFHFGSIAMSMWTFFEMSTLENWSTILYLNIYGCAEYSAFNYIIVNSSYTGDLIRHRYGGMILPICSNSHSRPILATLLFVSFTIFCGFILMNLTIAAVAAGIKDRLDELRKEGLEHELGLTQANGQLSSRGTGLGNGTGGGGPSGGRFLPHLTSRFGGGASGGGASGGASGGGAAGGGGAVSSLLTNPDMLLILLKQVWREQELYAKQQQQLKKKFMESKVRTGKGTGNRRGSHGSSVGRGTGGTGGGGRRVSGRMMKTAMKTLSKVIEESSEVMNYSPPPHPSSSLSSPSSSSSPSPEGGGQAPGVGGNHRSVGGRCGRYGIGSETEHLQQDQELQGDDENENEHQGEGHHQRERGGHEGEGEGEDHLPSTTSLPPSSSHPPLQHSPSSLQEDITSSSSPFSSLCYSLSSFCSYYCLSLCCHHPSSSSSPPPPPLPSLLSLFTSSCLHSFDFKYQSMAMRSLTNHFLYQPISVTTVTISAIIELYTLQLVNKQQQQHNQQQQQQPGITDVLQISLQVIFTMDLYCKVMAAYPGIMTYFYNRWNQFDAALVLATWIPVIATSGMTSGAVAQYLGLFRILRILRLLKMLSWIPELNIILHSVASSVRALVYVIILMFAFFWHFAVAGVFMFAQNDPQHFGTFFRAFLTILQIASLDNWSDVARTNMYGCDIYNGDDTSCENPHGLGWIAAWYFIIIVVIGVMVLLSLFVGIIITSMELLKEGIKEEKEVWGKVKVKQKQYNMREATIKNLLEIFDLIDIGENGKLTLNELKQVLNVANISEANQFSLFMMVDTDSSGQIDFSEFLELIHLVGKAYSFNSAKKLKRDTLHAAEFQQELHKYQKGRGGAKGGAGGGGGGERGRREERCHSVVKYPKIHPMEEKEEEGREEGGIRGGGLGMTLGGGGGGGGGRVTRAEMDSNAPHRPLRKRKQRQVSEESSSEEEEGVERVAVGTSRRGSGGVVREGVEGGGGEVDDLLERIKSTELEEGGAFLELLRQEEQGEAIVARRERDERQRDEEGEGEEGEGESVMSEMEEGDDLSASFFRREMRGEPHPEALQKYQIQGKEYLSSEDDYGGGESYSPAYSYKTLQLNLSIKGPGQGEGQGESEKGEGGEDVSIKNH